MFKIIKMENKESLEAISLSCRKILKLLSGFLLLQKDQQKGKDRRVSAILNLMYRMTCGNRGTGTCFMGNRSRILINN